MSANNPGVDQSVASVRTYPFPLAVVFVAVLAMMAQATGVDLPGTQVRNGAVALMVLLMLSALARGRRAPGAGLSLSICLFAGWVVLRVVHDSGLAAIPLLLVLWFPFTYFTARLSRTVEPSIGRLSLAYLLVASFVYLSAAFGEGLHGPQMINAAYYILLVLPFAIALKSTTLRQFALSLILIVVLASEKRTALVALVAGLLAAGVFAGLARRRIDVGGQRPAIMAGLLIVVGAAAYAYVANRFGIDLLAKLGRFEEDGGSGRAAIYDWVTAELSSSSTGELFLGRGQDAVAAATGGLSAHNDFLEIAYDFGLVGLLLYLSVYVALVRVLIRMVRVGSPMAAPWAASIAVFAVVSLLSHLVFVPTYLALSATFWGLGLRHATTRSHEGQLAVQARTASEPALGSQR